MQITTFLTKFSKVSRTVKWFFRLALPLVLICDTAAATAAISITTEAGYLRQAQGDMGRRLWDLNTWNPVEVVISGAQPGNKATVQLTLSTDAPGSHHVTFFKTITLIGGIEPQVVHFALPPAGLPPAYASYTPHISIAAKLLTNGSVSSNVTQITSRDLVGYPAMQLLLLTSTGDLSYLQNAHGANALPVPKLAAYSSQPLDWRSHYRFLLPPPGGLPESALAYDPASAVVLHDLPRDGLNERQVNALKEYVYSGGLLIASGGSFGAMQNSAVAALLPVVPVSVENVKKLTALQNYAGAVARFPQGIAMTVAKPKPGSVELCITHKGIPVVSAIRRGNGYVIYCAINLFDPAMRNYAKSPELWARLLQNSSTEHRVFKLSRFTRLSLANALAGQRAIAMPSLWLFAAFCSVYAVLVGPINYYVLKRYDRKELSWITIPLLVALFSIVAIIVQISLRGAKPSVHTALIMQSSSGSPQVSGAIQSSLYSTAQNNYRLTYLGDPANGIDCSGYTPNVIKYSNPFIYSNSDTGGIDEHDGVTAAINVPIAAYATTAIGCAFSGTYPGVSVDVLACNKHRLTLRIHNNLAQPLNDVAFLLRNNPFVQFGYDVPSQRIQNSPHMLAVPNCAARSTITCTLSKADLRRLPSDDSFQYQSPNHLNLRDSMLRYLLVSLTYPTPVSEGITVPQHAWRPRLVAWNTQPLARLRVDNLQLKGKERNLVVVSVSDSSLKVLPFSVRPQGYYIGKNTPNER